MAGSQTRSLLITITTSDVNPYSPSLQYMSLHIFCDLDAEFSNVQQTATIPILPTERHCAHYKLIYARYKFT